jgi:hypothetical protein
MDTQNVQTIVDALENVVRMLDQMDGTLACVAAGIKPNRRDVQRTREETRVARQQFAAAVTALRELM